MLLCLLSCEEKVPFPVEESGRIYVNAMMTDDGMSRIDVAVSQPIGGGETVASADVTLRITADGQPLELFRDAELSSDEVQSYYSEAQLYSGQRLVLEAHAEGLPEVRSEAVMPEAILRPEVVREEVVSFKDEIPGQTMDGMKRLWQFMVFIPEEVGDEYFGVQLLKRRQYEFKGNVPPGYESVYPQTGVVKVDNLYADTQMEGNGIFSSVRPEIMVGYMGGDMLVSKAVLSQDRCMLQVTVAPEKRYLLEGSYGPDPECNYEIYEYCEYKVRIMRISDQAYDYFRSRYAVEESDIPIHLGFTPATYTYTNVVGGLGIFGAASVFETEWTEYE